MPPATVPSEKKENAKELKGTIEKLAQRSHAIGSHHTIGFTGKTCIETYYSVN